MTLHERFTLEVPQGKPLKLTRAGGNGGFVLPEGARRKVPGRSWGVFTIACTIPIRRQPTLARSRKTIIEGLPTGV
jgi:carbon starvation protein